MLKPVLYEDLIDWAKCPDQDMKAACHWGLLEMSCQIGNELWCVYKVCTKKGGKPYKI